MPEHAPACERLRVDVRGPLDADALVARAVLRHANGLLLAVAP